MRQWRCYISKLARSPWTFARLLVDRILVPLQVRWLGVKVGHGCRFVGTPIAKLAPGSHLVLGNNISILSRPGSNPAGLPHPTILATLASDSSITIGDGTGITGASIVARTGITIGRHVLIGAGACIWDTDFHPLDPHRRREDQTRDARSAPIHIEDDVFIGARALILKGIRIGKGAVVGAGAVVTKNVDAHQMVGGNPARSIGQVNTPSAETSDSERAPYDMAAGYGQKCRGSNATPLERSQKNGKPERILLLSWTVPPEITGSAVVVENLAKQFTREEMVVAGERPHDRPALAWKDEWPQIMYLTNGWAQTSRGARWRRKLQIPLLVFRCWRLVRQYRCTKLLVVFPSEEYLLTGYVVAKMSGAQLYPYFHNTYVEQCGPNSIGYWFARWLQSRVFARAEHIFVMSDGMVSLYRERYPNLAVKCSPLVHSFNEDIPEFSSPPEPGTPLHFALSGNINASCAEATVRVCAAISRIESKLTIVSGTAKTYLRQLGLLQEHVNHGLVSRDVMLRNLAEADIVVLAHGFTGHLSFEEYATIFPTRTIEYLICGRPILAHAPAYCYLTRFLREQNCALVVDDPRIEAVLAGINRLRQDADLRSRLVRNALRTAERFRGTRVASTLRFILCSSPAPSIQP